MFSKRRVVLTAVVTFVITAIVAISGTYLYCRITSYDIVTQAKKVISDRYVDPLTEEQIKKMEDHAISAMVASLEDPYSYYFDEKLFDSYEENTKEEYVGIGVNVNFDAEKGKLVVITPTDGSPAQKAGILPGDIITKVDDFSVTEKSYNDIVDYIRGEKAEKGSAIKIYIERSGEEKVFEVVRDIIPLETISYKMLDNSVGYIRISEFKHNSVDDFSEALEAIKKQDAKGLIIDLRSNPGGYADSVLRMTDMLLPEGTIAYLEDNKGKREYFYSDEKHIGLPMTILVNEGTASAAELMAGSTQAHGVGKIVGKKTYGKAVGQTPFMLTEETAIYLTCARYYTPKGECIDKKGIMPDVEIDLPDAKKSNLTSLEVAEDDQLRMALEVLYDAIKGEK